MDPDCMTFVPLYMERVWGGKKMGGAFRPAATCHKSNRRILGTRGPHRRAKRLVPLALSAAIELDDYL
jgi:hypothetical protein